MSSRFLTVCLSPTIQKTIRLSSLTLDRVNRGNTVLKDASGKGINVSRVLVQNGDDVVYLSHLGFQYKDFLKLLSRDRIPIEWEDSGSLLRECITLVDDHSGTTTEIIEPSENVLEGTEERILKLYKNLVYQFDWVIISGSRSSGYSDRIIPQLVSLAKEVGRKVIMDCRGEDLNNSLKFRPDYIKPNREEFVQTFFPGQDNGQIPASEMQKMIKMKMIDLYRQFGIATILTDGADIIYYLDEGKQKKLQPETIKAVNGTGSGDAFTAGLASALGRGKSLKDAVLQGSNFGAKNAQLIRPGVIQ